MDTYKIKSMINFCNDEIKKIDDKMNKNNNLIKEYYEQIENFKRYIECKKQEMILLDEQRMEHEETLEELQDDLN
jgi:DNA repair ATPase RecN